MYEADLRANGLGLWGSLPPFTLAEENFLSIQLMMIMVKCAILKERVMMMVTIVAFFHDRDKE